jgi:hypothetical protein
MREQCYACGAPKTSYEHAPPECFFPKGYDSGLVTVPSCDDHNSRLSLDVEYVRNNLCGQHGTNLVAARAFETTKSSYDNSPKLFNRTFSGVQQIILDGQETGAYPIELSRFKKVMKAIAFAMYFQDFGKRHEGDFDVFSASLRSRSNLYHGIPDGYENLRGVLEATFFKSMPVPQPKVFKYGMSRPGEGQIHYRFEFYEGFSVYALTLPYKLNPLIYLPVTRDCMVFRLGRDSS